MRNVEVTIQILEYLICRLASRRFLDEVDMRDSCMQGGSSGAPILFASLVCFKIGDYYVSHISVSS